MQVVHPNDRYLEVVAKNASAVTQLMYLSEFLGTDELKGEDDLEVAMDACVALRKVSRDLAQLTRILSNTLGTDLELVMRRSFLRYLDAIRSRPTQPSWQS